ncbi:error-prone DNA polymerase [Deinococcus metalli]|uniref:DNA-directed DNA polymerase n=2 Tax=Deinococcus metalli TaxID=1141878 RepID=A0A7W8NQX5_9DEIO|nr:DNA polymerase III subunit alpha [Deinococcus metalli]MBB5378321.1 error-prone DNA polymerase [Deinococcus metalli]GHF59729.1 error-prone DNA polymerase [Deinococcus metalli]
MTASPDLRLDALLDVRSYFTPGGGVCSPTTLLQGAARRGFRGLGLTDHASTAGAVELCRAAQETGVQGVVGATLDVRLPEGTFPLRLLAATRAGYGHLNALLTVALARPEQHVTAAELCAHAEDIVLLTGGRDSFPAALLAQRRTGDVLARLHALRDVFHGRLFVQLFHGAYPGDGRRARLLWLLAREARLPSVAAPLVQLERPAQFPLLDALCCARLGIDLDTPHAARPRNDRRALRTPRAWGRALPFPDALANAAQLAAECRVELLDGGFSVPPPHLPPGADAHTHLRERCVRALTPRYPRPDQRAAAAQRLERELDVVAQHGLAGFFLVAAEVTDYCRGQGILAAGRGSAAASVLCYLLGITTSDPLAHDLLFERFLHTGQTMMPDVDIDIASHRRREVLSWVEERFGVDGVGEAMVANRITYRLPGAVQDLGRALGLPPEWRDRLTRALGRDFRHLPPHQARKAAPAFDEVLGTAPVRGTLLDLLALMEPGFVRHLAPHSGGVVLSARPLTHTSPLVTSSGGIRMLTLDKDDAEAAGLIKLDLLGLRMLSALERAREEIVRLGGPYVDFGALPDDPRVWARIARGDTLGLFQIESPGQTRLSTQLRARTRLELAHQIALFRPGPIQSATVHPYLRRARGQEPVPALMEPLASILRHTHGVILFQEQILRIAHRFAGYPWLDAERLRRTLGKAPPGEARDALRREFVLGAARTVGAFPFESEEVFEWCAAFQGFGFAESHAHAFAFHTYASAWVREHWPAPYLAGVLGEAPGMWPAATLAQEARRWGVTLRPACVNASAVRPRAEDTRHVRVGLGGVVGVSDGDAQRIVLERHLGGPYRDLADLHARVELERGTLDALAQAGCVDALHARREALYRAGVLAAHPRAGQPPLLLPVSDPPPLPELTDAERLDWNLRRKGLSEDGLHPMTLLRAALIDAGAEPLGRVRSGAATVTAGVIVSRQKPPTARGYAFFVIEDGPHRAQVVISPELWSAHRQLLRDARALIVRADAVREGLHLTLRAHTLADLEIPWRAGGYDYA